jgi:hypothetical protein
VCEPQSTKTLARSRPGSLTAMTVAPYTLRLYPPPPRLNGAPPLPRPRPHISRRAAAKVSTSWLPAGGDPDDGVGGWRVPEPPVERERRNGKMDVFFSDGSAVKDFSFGRIFCSDSADSSFQGLAELSRSCWERLRLLAWPGWRGALHPPENVS